MQNPKLVISIFLKIISSNFLKYDRSYIIRNDYLKSFGYITITITIVEICCPFAFDVDFGVGMFGEPDLGVFATILNNPCTECWKK